LARYEQALEDRVGHRLLLLALYILDFLAIHPVADGNGRLARLLTTAELFRQDYDIARYVSVEQRIYDSKNSYYTALRQSQRDWHTAGHDIWPWAEYLVKILADSYQAFEQQMATATSTAGMSKQDIVRRWVLNLTEGTEFQIRQIRAAVPGISDPTIRIVLTSLRTADPPQLKVSGVGAGATWTRL
jgi:Fic family protein